MTFRSLVHQTVLLLLLCDATEKTVAKEKGDASKDGEILERGEHVQMGPVAVVQGKYTS